jgi:hypothetical protein
MVYSGHDQEASPSWSFVMKTLKILFLSLLLVPMLATAKKDDVAKVRDTK